MSDIREKADDEKYCSSCGAIILLKAEICPKCGVRQMYAASASAPMKKPWEYFIDVMQKYAVFSGRARRAEYWWFSLCILVISIASSIIGLIIGSWFDLIVSIGLIIPGLAVTWRRMHDVGKAGPYCFIPIYSIILSVTDGERGVNKYGPNPKEAA